MKRASYEIGEREGIKKGIKEGILQGIEQGIERERAKLQKLLKIYIGKAKLKKIL